MTDLDRKLAALAVVTGRSPVHDEFRYGMKAVDCYKVTCGLCPFSEPDAIYRNRCTAPVIKEVKKGIECTIRTYEDALANYPELFL
jgi:hypothetical protein